VARGWQRPPRLFARPPRPAPAAPAVPPHPLPPTAAAATTQHLKTTPPSLLEVLEGDGKYFAWNRWGRVGEPGQSKLQACGGLAQAAQEFEKKFREKTQNPWSQRANFKPVNGKYHIVETEDAEGGGDDHAPMGKLTEAQIGKGQHVLDKLDKELKKSSPTRSQLEVLSSEFYTLIPHNFGRARPPAISTQEMLEAKVELLKFYLRMGFEEVEEDAGRSPVSGVMALPVPASLDAACGGLCAKGQIVQSTKKGEELARRQAGRPSTAMAASLYAAIMLYTSNAIYRDLNQESAASTQTATVSSSFSEVSLGGRRHGQAHLEELARMGSGGASGQISSRLLRGSWATTNSVLH
ncbi:unnamed protein product, partial [Prorocentrum cordatum]